MARVGPGRPTGREKRQADAAVGWRAAPLGGRTGCGAAWLARCVRDAEVPGSNPGSPTLKALFRELAAVSVPKPSEQLARKWRGNISARVSVAVVAEEPIAENVGRCPVDRRRRRGVDRQRDPGVGVAEPGLRRLHVDPLDDERGGIQPP